MKKKSVVLIFLLLCFFSRTSYADPFRSKINLFTPGFNFGIGIPKIPISHYRTPIAICGGIVTYFGITSRFAFQVSANGLYTFNLGSVIQGNNKLKFNLFWGDICFDYKLKFSLNTDSYISPGIGYYNLFQQFDDAKDDLTTFGLTVGLLTNNYGRKNITQFEIRWHLLFHPESKPQVLTIKFGFLL